MIHYFNPGHETAVLNKSKYYMAPANVVSMQRELAFLAAWYASPGDYVWVEELLPDYFFDFLSAELGLNVKAVTRQYISENKTEFYGQEVCLWGISPQSVYLFEQLSSEFDLNLKIPEWNDEYVPLCSRETARRCLEYLSDIIPDIEKDIIPSFYNSLDEIEKAVSDTDARLLLKAPYSSSGRGLLWLPQGKLTRTERQIIHGHLKKQGLVSLEKVLDRKLDFAMEFTLQDGKVKYEGLSLFETNAKGAYLGNFLGVQKIIEKRLAEHIDIAFLHDVRVILEKFISENIASVYNGRVGVDMMIYRNNGEYKLHPCLEINVRNNMGFVALNLSQKFLAEGSVGDFHIDFSPHEGEIYARDNEMKQNHPLITDERKIRSGYLSLCPVLPKSRYRAYIQVKEV